MKTLEESEESATAFFNKQLAIINDPRVPQKDRDAALAYTLRVFKDLVDMLDAIERKYGHGEGRQ